jgi:N6-L-threonylcarbamoyladenine synthase
MKILGIETSCDETAVCLIEASGTGPEDFAYKVLGNALYSQVAIHAPYGGVFPNLAKREHAKNLVPLMQQVLEQSDSLIPGPTPHDTEQMSALLAREPELLEQLSTFLAQYGKPDIDAIAVTAGPGLEPALWVGVNFARALNLAWGIPIVAANHMEGHVMMSMVQEDHFEAFEFPVLSLLISGGHTELVLSREWMQYERIGQTRDDAVGEAFDKVARLLDLPYPGGPQISRLAREARAADLSSTIHFTPPMLHSGDFDFSFSGIKTEVRRLVESMKPLNNETKIDIACAFEDAVTQVLVAKTIKAADDYGARTVVVGGGVSANTYIRQRLAEALEEAGHIQLLVPPPDLATDNAIMIALPGYFHAIKKDFADAGTLRANGNLRLV